jgi:hypothetical protein
MSRSRKGDTEEGLYLMAGLTLEIVGMKMEEKRTVPSMVPI